MKYAAEDFRKQRERDAQAKSFKVGVTFRFDRLQFIPGFGAVCHLREGEEFMEVRLEENP